jgi:hypothetical protein
MGYDYSSDSKTFDVPNPYKLQNRLLFLASAVLLLAGISSLWQTRNLLKAAAGLQLVAPLVCSIGLLMAGLLLATRAATRLRFFFGRGRPHSLAPDLANGTYGGSREAEALKETIRQGALTYPEPHGALEGLLYNRVPHLITAPYALQNQARLHFFNLAALSATLLSYVFAWGIFGDETSRPWVSVMYGLFGVFFLLRPVTGHHEAALSTSRLVILILAAVLTPVGISLIGDMLPSLGELSLHIQVFALLIGSLVVVALAMAATLAQVMPPPQTRTSAEVVRVSLQGPPAAVLDEMERVMQAQWTERVPNRRYSRLEPQTPLTQKSGSFNGEIMEESQPVPRAVMAVPEFGSALSSPMHRWLVVSDLLCTGLLCIAAGLILIFVSRFNPLAPLAGNLFSLLGTAVIFGMVAGFGLSNAALLWGRFDFTSDQFSSQMQTESEIVRVESMSLRVWRARLESVVFGKDSARQVTALFSTDIQAKDLCAHLVKFAQSQSVIAAPQAAEDLRRMAMIGQAGQVLASPAAITHGGVSGLLDRPPTTPHGAGKPAVTFCSACGAKLPPDARFCAACGASQHSASPESA